MIKNYNVLYLQKKCGKTHRFLADIEAIIINL
jgi:hypothetical protein